MKTLLVVILCIVSCTGLIAQKPALDTSVLGKWPSVESPTISDDGRYISYIIKGQPVGGQTLILQAATSDWQRSFAGTGSGIFCDNNKQYVFLRKDTLFSLGLGTSELHNMPGVSSYQQPSLGRSIWLAYQLSGSGKELVLRDLAVGKETRFSGVASYQFNASGDALILKLDSNGCTQLRWVSLPDMDSKVIWSSAASTDVKLLNYTFDNEGKQLAIMIHERVPPHKSNSIWYYKTGMERAVLESDDKTSGVDSGLTISNDAPFFTMNGKYIIAGVQEDAVAEYMPVPGGSMVDVWSFRDSILQSHQLKDLEHGQVRKTYRILINLKDHRVTQIEKGNEQLTEIWQTPRSSFFLLRDLGSTSDKFWLGATITYSLVKAEDNIIIRSLSGKFDGNIDFSFSTLGGYLVYYYHQHYYSSNLSSGKTVEISKSVPISLCKKNEYLLGKLPGRSVGNVGIAGWASGDSIVLIYDDYDIWCVDPEGIRKPMNLTQGYGRAHNIEFRLAEPDDRILSKNSRLLLTAFNTINKDNGFYSVSLAPGNTLEKLGMGPSAMYITSQQVERLVELGSNLLKPIKARDTNSWIVKRQSTVEAPNLFLTHDFIYYAAITNLQPQKAYNWMTAKLINWKLPDGRLNQGVLYKPENFDPHKKYPLIIKCYEQYSQVLHIYFYPTTTGYSINIPWFVSKGYLVFIPDICYTVGHPGQSAYNAIISAVKTLSKMPYVDAKKIGINGHSFGGYETNYMVTHTNIFAAAAEGAGVSDWMSAYGSLRPGIEDNQVLFEMLQYRVGSDPWNGKDLYVENSPILKLDKVTTPLLIMHNKNDAAVPWAQGIELFKGLRRLNKTVWMLQYDNGGHTVFGKDALDYTLRLTQFFDHYLKHAPAPVWMTKGIPARLKGIETRYELDLTGGDP